MHKGTTPTYTFTLPSSASISSASAVYVTFAPTNDTTAVLTKTGDDLTISGNNVEVFLTQTETLSFPVGRVQVQLNWLYNEDGITKRACSKIMIIPTSRNLIDEELENE